jgi:hypothetical protein
MENVKLPVYLASHFLYQATSIYLTRTRSQCKSTSGTKCLTRWTCRLKFAAVYWLVFLFIHSLVWTTRVLSEAARWNLPGIPMGVVTTTRQRAELAMATMEQVSTTSNLLLLLLLLLLTSSLVTGLSFLVLLLNQRWSPPLTLQASHCSTFRIMCDVPSIAVFCYYYYYYYTIYTYWSVYINCRIELNSIWVRGLPDPTHLGLKTGPLCPMFCTKLQEPCSFSTVPDRPHPYNPDILRVQKEGTQIFMPEWG